MTDASLPWSTILRTAKWHERLESSMESQAATHHVLVSVRRVWNFQEHRSTSASPDSALPKHTNKLRPIICDQVNVSGLIHPQIVSARYAAVAGTQLQIVCCSEQSEKQKNKPNRKQNNDDGRPNEIHFNILLQDLYT